MLCWPCRILFQIKPRPSAASLAFALGDACIIKSTLFAFTFGVAFLRSGLVSTFLQRIAQHLPFCEQFPSQMVCFGARTFLWAPFSKERGQLETLNPERLLELVNGEVIVAEVRE